MDRPTYEVVCTDTTGHAEAIEVEFDPSRVTYTQLVDIFFGIHDPMQRNRQGPDLGTQSRSAIFFRSPEQENLARETIEKERSRWPRPIVTELVAATTFWPAEEYHQRYHEKHGGSCGI